MLAAPGSGRYRKLAGRQQRRGRLVVHSESGPFRSRGRDRNPHGHDAGIPERCACRQSADQLLDQLKGRMPAAAGPEQPAIGGEKWTIMFHGESHVNAIPQGHPVTQ